MAYPIFPSLAGLGLTAKRTPVWSSSVQKTQSGKKTFLSYMSYPLYQWSLDFTALRSYTGYGELAQMIAFVNNVRGMAGQFLYMDPEDNTATAQGFGTGDGTTTQFQLVRQYGGYAEPVQNPLNPQIYRNQDWQGNQLLYATPRTNLCLGSQTIGGSQWTLTSCTATANAALAPDGTTTASTLTASASTTARAQSAIETVTASTIYTVSAYLSAGSSARSAISVYNSGLTVQVAGQTISWSGGVPSIGAATGGVVAGSQVITPMANGMYRISYAFNTGTNTSVRALIYPDNLAGTNTVNAWGCQFELGGTVTSYLLTTTAAVTVTDYSINATGVVTFTAAPLAAAALTWSGQFYYLCNFLQDNPEFDQEHINIWSLSGLKFESVKL